jgi:hypothetical protein
MNALKNPVKKYLAHCHFLHHKCGLDGTRVSAEGDQRITAWPVEQPASFLNIGE